MPKAARERIRPRGMVQISRGTGTSSITSSAAAKPSGMGQGGGRAIIAPANYASSTFAQLSPTFAKLAGLATEKWGNRQVSEASSTNTPRRRCNPAVDNEQKAIAARGVATLGSSLKAGLATGEISEPTQIQEAVRDTASALDAIENPEVRRYMEAGIGNAEETALHTFIDQQEEQRRGELRGQADALLSSLIEGDRV